MTSHRSSLARLSATAALAALMLGGCALDGNANRPSRHAAAPLKGHGAKVHKAVTRAERAVLAAPRDAAARATLGALYLDAGRFASAVEAYDAALELGDESVATVLGLALAETAQGNGQAALELLNDWRDIIPAGDLGLATALAGQTARGVAILADALRAGDPASAAKTRQNLAFAYALDGRWREARLMVAQDVPADEVDARISEWALLARADNVQGRVAHLLAVPVVGDPGQPAALALANFPSPEALALQAATETQPQPEAAPEPVAYPARVEVAAAPAAELPPVVAQAVLAMPAPPSAPAPQPITLAAFDPPAAKVASDVPAIAAAPAPVPVKPRIVGSYVPPEPAAAPPARVKPRVVGSYVPQGQPAAQPGKTRTRIVARPAAKVVSGGSHWLQLGSYTDPAVASEGWGKFTARTPALKPYRATTTTATVNGARVWRVAAAGFASYGDAAQMCRTVRARGGACLVVTAPREARAGAFASLKR